jgi:hypothetical protein
MQVATIADMMIAVIFGFEFMILAGPFSSLSSQIIFTSRENFRCRGAIVEARLTNASLKLNFFWGLFFGCFSIFTDAHRRGAQQ